MASTFVQFDVLSLKNTQVLAKISWSRFEELKRWVVVGENKQDIEDRCYAFELKVNLIQRLPFMKTMKFIHSWNQHQENMALGLIQRCFALESACYLVIISVRPLIRQLLRLDSFCEIGTWEW